MIVTNRENLLDAIKMAVQSGNGLHTYVVKAADDEYVFTQTKFDKPFMDIHPNGDIETTDAEAQKLLLQHGTRLDQ